MPDPHAASRPPAKAKKKKSAMQDMAGTMATAIIILIVLSIFVFPLFNRSKEGKIIGKEIEALGRAIEAYQSEFGALPTGNHREISRTLCGANSANKSFVELDRRDDDGRLLDPWNNPYQFFVSNDGFVIRSAGPDGRFDHGAHPDGDDHFYASK